MKTAVAFLALPFLATMGNVLFVLVALRFRQSHGQPVLPDARLVDRCIDTNGQDCVFSLNDYVPLHEHEDEEQGGAVLFEIDSKEEADPMLMSMPDVDFMAYVRADVATFYGEAPGSIVESKPAFRGQACKFVNMSPDPVTIYWVGPSGETVLNDNTGPWQSGGTACHPSHKFMFTKPNQPKEVLCRITVVAETQVYYCDPFVPNDSTDPARGHLVSPAAAPKQEEALRNMTPNNRERYDALVFNLEFAAKYKNFTGGSEWLSMYPRNPPMHKIWRADYFGQTHSVQTKETHFFRTPQGTQLHPLSIQEMRKTSSKTTNSRPAELSLAQHRAPGLLNLTMTALSSAPRIFEIRHFLSDAEVDHLLAVVEQKHGLERSTTNGHLSTTRTSRTTWLPRHTDPVIDAIFRRGADLLQIDEALLRHRQADERLDMPTTAPMNEDLQIVHYARGQEYTAHHDFSYPNGMPDSPSRAINLCFYLNNVSKGGQTSFPRWRNAELGGPSLDVTPEKGKAVVFYMVTPDGNLDDLSQHAAMPVLEGEKYFANLWIWDPIRT